MNLANFRKTLRTQLAAACNECLTRVKSELADQTIYAFTIFASSGYVTLGVAVATLESLQKRNASTPADQVQKFVNTMNASEWQYMNCHHALFDTVNESIDAYYDCLFDSEFEDHAFRDAVTTAELDEFTNTVFIDAVVSVMQELKDEQCFVGENFVSDILFGVQFVNPSKFALDAMERVSAQINSRIWHEKVVQNCSYYKTGLPSSLP